MTIEELKDRLKIKEGQVRIQADSLDDDAFRTQVLTPSFYPSKSIGLLGKICG